MKIYFLDKQFLSPDEEEQLRRDFTAAGIEILFRAYKKSEEVIEGAKDADGVILMAVHITEVVMDALPKLQFIGRCGIGVDNVDVKAATGRGIAVCNVPDHCTYEVASHAFALMMALKRQLPAFIKRAREGGYAQGTGICCTRIRGEVMGIAGYGRIGRELGRMALGMGMRVLVYDPCLNLQEEEGVEPAEDLDTLLRQSDVVSLHMPLFPATHHMISGPQLRKMKRSAVLINAARGPVVDTEALIQALKEGVIAGAGLDVCEGEPLPADHELLSMENVIFTPHVGMYSVQAMEDMYHKLTTQAVDVLNGRWTKNIVNPEVREKAGLS